MNEAAVRPRRRWIVPVLWVLSVIVAAAVAWVAAVQATSPEQLAEPSETAVTVAVAEQTIRVEQVYVVNATWPQSSTGVNGLAGTLTSVDAAGESVQAGDTLYSVDLQPAVAMQGSVPAFRDLAPGARGADVSQLQRFLIEAEYLGGEPTGTYDPATAAAVLAWSRASGFGDSNTVPRGRIVFLPELPSHVALVDDLAVGSEVMPGQSVIAVVTAEPRLSLPVLADAASRIQPGMLVEIPNGDSHWSAQVSEIVTSADTGELEAVLAPVDGEDSICADACSELAAAGSKSQLQGTLILVPETTGPAIPTAAIRVDAQGETSVLLADGTSVPVTVVASAQGISVVEGLEVGQQVIARSGSDEQP